MNFRTHRTLVSAGLMAAWLAGAGISPVAWAARPTLQAAPAQGSAAASPANNLVGTVTAMEADSLTVKLESGGEAMIAITPQTRLLRTAPGEKTLKGATPIHLEDLATGDRVLVLRATPGAEPGHYSAAAVVTMKQADIAQARAAQAEDWQRRGVDGIVKSVEPAPAGGTATIVLGTAQPGRTVAIHVTPATEIRRYASDSVNFADSRPAALADIHPGDQLRARGDRNADGTEVTAVEIVSGSFRNVAGTITAIDPAQNTLTVTDLATKKPVTMRLTAQTQMRKLPPEMAQRLAARSGQPGGQAAAGPGAARPFGQGQPPAGIAHASDTPPGANPGPAGEPGGGPTRVRGDAAGMLQHAPLVTLAELKKGDAIMVVAARGGGGVSDAATAITLIAGVEALLQSSSGSASQNLFSASWNLSGGGGAEGAAQ